MAQRKEAGVTRMNDPDQAKATGARGRTTGLVILLLFALILGACARPSDEEQIRAAISEMQNAIESGKPADFMRHIADDFTGDAGGIDKQGLHNFLRGQALTNAKIGINLVTTDVELQGDRATVKVTVTITGGSGRWLPERGSVQQIESGWRRQDGDWLCLNAQWQSSL